MNENNEKNEPKTEREKKIRSSQRNERKPDFFQELIEE